MITSYTKYILIPYLFLFTSGSVAAAEMPSLQQMQQQLQQFQTKSPEEKMAEIRKKFIAQQNQNEYDLGATQKGYQTIFEELPLPLLCLSLIVCVSVFADSLYRFLHIKENTPLVYISLLFCPIVAILQGVAHNFGEIHQVFFIPIATSIVVLLCWSLALIVQEWPQTFTLSPADMLLFTLCLFVAAYYYVVEDCKAANRLPFTFNGSRTAMEEWKENNANQGIGVKINYFLIEGWAQGSTTFSFQEKNHTLVTWYTEAVEAAAGTEHREKDFYDALLTDKQEDATTFFRGINGDSDEYTQQLASFKDVDADTLRDKIKAYKEKLRAMETTFDTHSHEAQSAMDGLATDESGAKTAYAKVINLYISHRLEVREEANKIKKEADMIQKRTLIKS